MQHPAVVVLAFLVLPAARLPAPATAASPAAPAASAASDCSAVHGTGHASCVHVACGAEYASFIGTWKGRFHVYLRKQSSPGHPVFRPYDESMTYAASDCLRNRANGDTFIVGHETGRYPAFGRLPAKVERTLLVTGRRADGTPYLRQVTSEGNHDYRLPFRDAAAGLSVWRLELPAANGQPPMTFTTIDQRDPAQPPTAHRRDVTVTMRVGPERSPYWQGVIVYGSHARG